jgi:hypothetical protein
VVLRIKLKKDRAKNGCIPVASMQQQQKRPKVHRLFDGLFLAFENIDSKQTFTLLTT